ncbi:hypothetical protein Calow_1883 [Caldicellulosiruptor owensensis OL]|uniref:Uncharacterized protein n=1 Tax=Caldicellulosiruptor owensensis (strain ATCC 700167 / DSM 13100 / OL) TaxID=632518 RepID=E4Q5C8_CALOW|nr:hypothetical protein [Caldicellulosiruptor owensensis]ADQ05412.1 hypothetical protein Calow_1883 [Caldicellulosiruptor owensensis OL]
MKKYRLFSILIIVYLLSTLPAYTFAKTNLSINHDEEIYVFKRQLEAETYLNAMLMNLDKDELLKEEIASATGFEGSYIPENFKLSEEYLYFRLFQFPAESKLSDKGSKYYVFKDDIKEKIKNLKFESLDDALNTDFVQKGWARVILYKEKPIGYLLISWDSEKYNYSIFYSIIGSSGLGEAIENMKKFLSDKGLKPKVKIVDILDMGTLYVVSDDGNWWCTDAKGYEKQIWNFKDIKDALNKRPREILESLIKLSNMLKESPDKVPLGGNLCKPLYEIVAEREKKKNATIAILLAALATVFVVGVKLRAKYKKQI